MKKKGSVENRISFFLNSHSTVCADPLNDIPAQKDAGLFLPLQKGQEKGTGYFVKHLKILEMVSETISWHVAVRFPSLLSPPFNSQEFSPSSQ